LPLIVSAHLDTVFPADTPLDCRREDDRVHGPGIGDNSLGVASLIGMLWRLRERGAVPAGDIWLVANVGEEGLGNLRGMKAVVNRFGGNVKAYLVIEGTALAHVYHRAIAVQRYRVTIHTAGGHSWSDYGQPSAIHELARIVTAMAGLPIPASPRSSLNVGLISGGTGVNVVAPEAKLDLDIRSESPEALEELSRRVHDIVQSAARDGVSSSMELTGERPAGQIAQDHPLVKLAEACLAEQGLKATFTSGSTDANIPLSRGYPALVLGVTTGGGAHTVQEYIDIPLIETGVEQLVQFVQRVFRIP
jgi:acetylornithine deacetylase/succinyl-diaminopimelate desuccinylase-like protein